MKFKRSSYYNEKLLGKHLYEKIVDNDELLTVQEFFKINETQKEYVKEIQKKLYSHCSYKLIIKNDYYELDCKKNDIHLYLLFNKPVHIIGAYCSNIISPEIIVKDSKNDLLSYCVTNKIIVDNNYNSFYQISSSKANNICFYNSKVNFYNSEVESLFIFKKNLKFYNYSSFLDGLKIKCFGYCDDLKEKLLNSEKYKKGIVHIE